MDWFLKLEPTVQIVVVCAAAIAFMVVVANLRILLQRPATLNYTETTAKSDEEKPDWFVEALKVMSEKAGPTWNSIEYKIEKTEKKPDLPKGPSGEQKAAPTLKVTRHYLYRDDGLFYNAGPGTWVSRADATWWTDLEEVREVRRKLADFGTVAKIEFVEEEG